jgi:hypothetical protein
MPVDELKANFNPRSFGRAIKDHLLEGVVYAVVIGVLLGVLGDNPLAALFGALVGVLAGAARSTYRPLESKRRNRPDQDIHHSALIAIRTGLLYGGVFGVIVGGLGDLWGGVVSGVLISILAGGLSYNGATVLRHYLVRLLLYVKHLLPFRIGQFMEVMRPSTLVQRTGVHYGFLHRTFQEHIAGLTDERIETLAQLEI